LAASDLQAKGAAVGKVSRPAVLEGRERLNPAVKGALATRALPKVSAPAHVAAPEDHPDDAGRENEHDERADNH
jgi:hypothetical protein